MDVSVEIVGILIHKKPGKQWDAARSNSLTPPKADKHHEAGVDFCERVQNILIKYP